MNLFLWMKIEKNSEIIAKYDLITLPVLNHDYQLIGVVTSDDAIEVIHSEQTEDFEKLWYSPRARIF